MKKIILVLLFVFGVNFSFANYYTRTVDRCCLVNLLDYKSSLNSISLYLEKNYPYDKRKLDNLIFKVVGIVNRKYKNNKVNTYKKLAFKISDYIYNHNIEKGTKNYYKLSYFALTMYSYSKFYEKESNVDLLVDELLKE